MVKSICAIDAVIISRRNHPQIKKPLDVETFVQLAQVGLGRELRGMTTADKTMVARQYQAADALYGREDLVDTLDSPEFRPCQLHAAPVRQQLIAPNFDLDIHELPIEVPEEHMYMTWHVNSEHDPGHRWLREAMLQAMQTNE